MTATASKKGDLKSLDRIAAEIRHLKAAGKWTLAEWERLAGSAEQAAGDEWWLLDSFANDKPRSSVVEK